MNAMRLTAWIWMAGASGALVLSGCPMGATVTVPQLPGLPVFPAGTLSPDAQALIQTVGPLALQAIAALVQAWDKYQSEKREADQREEENRRQVIAAKQNFFSELCTRKAPVTEIKPAEAKPAEAKPGLLSGVLPGSKASTAPKAAPVDAVALEKEAENSIAAGDYRSAMDALKKIYDSRKANAPENEVELARIANRLALAMLMSGEPVNATAYASQALSTRQKKADEFKKTKAPFENVLTADLDVADSKSTLAQIHRSGGAFKLAKEEVN